MERQQPDTRLVPLSLWENDYAFSPFQGLERVVHPFGRRRTPLDRIAQGQRVEPAGELVGLEIIPGHKRMDNPTDILDHQYDRIVQPDVAAYKDDRFVQFREGSIYLWPGPDHSYDPGEYAQQELACGKPCHRTKGRLY